MPHILKGKIYCCRFCALFFIIIIISLNHQFFYYSRSHLNPVFSFPLDNRQWSSQLEPPATSSIKPLIIPMQFCKKALTSLFTVYHHLPLSYSTLLKNHFCMSQCPLSPQVSNQKSLQKTDAFLPLFLLNLLPHFCDNRLRTLLWRVSLLMFNSVLLLLFTALQVINHPSFWHVTFEPTILSS